MAQGAHRTGHGSGRESGPVRESLREREEGLRGSARCPLPAARGRDDPPERLRVSEDGRRGNRSPYHPDEQFRFKRSVHHSPPWGHSGPSPDFESPTEDGGHPAETAATKEVSEMSHLHSAGPGTPNHRTYRERRGEGSRGAHAEALSDGEFVREPHREGTEAVGRESASHFFGDGPRTGAISDYTHGRPKTRNEPRLGQDAQFQNYTRPDRAAAARVAIGHLRSEDSRNVTGRESAGGPGERAAHRPRPELLVMRSYKRNRFMIDSAAVAKPFVRP